MTKIFKMADEDLFGKHLVVDKNIQKNLKKQKKSEQMKKYWQQIRFFRSIIKKGIMTHIEYKRNLNKLRYLTYFLCYLYDENSKIYLFKMIKLIKENKNFLINHSLEKITKINGKEFVEKTYKFSNKKGIIK